MQTMDVRFINPFLTAVGLVFRTTADMSVSLGKPRLKLPNDCSGRIYTVSAMIELSGNVQGVVSLRFCVPVIMALVKAMTGETPQQIDADCLDALGEVANMVVGNAKKDFPLGEVTISTPKVAVTDPLDAPPVLVLPFECAAGRFLIEARIQSCPTPKKAAERVDPELEKRADAILQEQVNSVSR